MTIVLDKKLTILIGISIMCFVFSLKDTYILFSYSEIKSTPLASFRFEPYFPIIHFHYFFYNRKTDTCTFFFISIGECLKNFKNLIEVSFFNANAIITYANPPSVFIS